MKTYKVGLIGCGAISENYLRYWKNVYCDTFTIMTVADILPERAKAKAEAWGIEKYGTPEAVYDDKEIDIVLNLTVPAAHEEVCVRALRAGKHVYSEKPLAISQEGIANILAEAEKAGKRVGCAPDSFLNAPMQTAKKAIEEDWIGRPIGVNAMCAMRGNEFWRPDADFFYQKGAGPMLDMGFYYFNVFVSLFGAVKKVQAMQKITFPERTIKVAPRKGEKIRVEVPTFVSASFEFDGGVIGTFINSFDIWRSTCPFIEIYGEKGTLVLPDPNRYDGEVLLRRMKDDQFRPLPQFVEYKEYGRGIGIVDMIRSMEAGVPHKASGEMAAHIFEVFDAINLSAEEGRAVEIRSTVSKPAGLFENQDSGLWA